MNLNTNPRFEDFEISDDPALAGYLLRVMDEAFARDDCSALLGQWAGHADKGFHGLTTAASGVPAQPALWEPDGAAGLAALRAAGG